MTIKISLLLAQLAAIISQGMGERYIAYYTAWSTYGRNFQVSNIPFDKLTHINYAFANIDASTGKLILGDPYADTQKFFPGDSWDTTKQAYMGNFWQLFQVHRPKYPNLKIMISVGGWTWSGEFSKVAATDQSRKVFVDSVVDFMQTYPFDGVDIDWEYPVLGGLETNTYSPNDGQNYVLLLKALRAGLTTLKGTKYLTIAAPAGPKIMEKLMISQMAPYIDFINVMTYDYRGGWSKYTGHQTPLYPPPPNVVAADDPDKPLGDTEFAINYYLEQGMPASKLVVGFAMYGRGWSGVTDANNGLYQTFKTIPKGTWDDGTSGMTGVYDYKDVKNKIATGQLKRYWDDTVKAPWGYANGFMVSFDDSESVKAKISFVKSKGLGGLMTWDLSGDDNAELSKVVFTNYLNGQIPSATPNSPTSPATPNTPSGPGVPADPNAPADPNTPADPNVPADTNSPGAAQPPSGDQKAQQAGGDQSALTPFSGMDKHSFIIGAIVGAGGILILVILSGLGFWLAKRKTHTAVGNGKKYFDGDAETPGTSEDSLAPKNSKGLLRKK